LNAIAQPAALGGHLVFGDQETAQTASALPDLITADCEAWDGAASIARRHRGSPPFSAWQDYPAGELIALSPNRRREAYLLNGRRPIRAGSRVASKVVGKQSD